MASENKESIKHPKVFISYSWTSESHQRRIVEWAERLMGDSIQVVMDVYELKEGNDKYKFMERMVKDEDVTHVLIFCDQKYREKADNRQDGVGTESQIISKEIYDDVDQSKFIPVVLEFDDNGDPVLPVFIKSRIWIDFSTDSAANDNWEHLIRLLFDKPVYQRPKLGEPPPYITSESTVPSNPAVAKLRTLRKAVLEGQPSTSLYRKEFLSSCLQYTEDLRVRERPPVDRAGDKILEDCRVLKQVRDLLVDWVLLESEIAPPEAFAASLISTLENLYALKVRQPDLNEWNDVWRESHSVFLYEVFLYMVAALLSTKADNICRRVLMNRYLIPIEDFHGDSRFESCGMFQGGSHALKIQFSTQHQEHIVPAAEVVKRQADRADLSFSEIIQADLVTFLLALVDNRIWYPQTAHYKSFASDLDLFVRATTLAGYQRLATLTEFTDPQQLRDTIRPQYQQFMAHSFFDRWGSEFIWSAMNMEKLATID